jgi:phosphohistidine phosphatase
VKQLLILRHAKATAEHAFDHGRQLNKVGRVQAPVVGAWLREKSLVPNLIVSSTAARALGTAALAASASGFQGVIRATTQLYLSDPDTHLATIQRIHGDPERLMIVGHNPALEDLLERLVGTPNHLATAALAVVGVDISDWADLRLQGQGTLVELWRPEQGEPNP